MVRRRSQRDRAADLLPDWVLSFDELAWPAETTIRGWIIWREEVRKYLEMNPMDLDVWLSMMASTYAVRARLMLRMDR